ncbi:hypothetical protein J6T93_02240 [bacterium]|nr:hypothetical protein [bacterium]
MNKIIKMSLLLTIFLTSFAFAGGGGLVDGWTEVHTYIDGPAQEPVPGFCYTIYRDKDCLVPLQTLWGNSLGVCAFKKMPAGAYFIRNNLASGGFFGDNTVVPFSIESGRCTVLDFYVKPSKETRWDGAGTGKFKFTISGTISGAAINDLMTSGGRIAFEASYGRGILTPEFKLVNKQAYSYLNGKDVSIKCQVNSQSLQFKIGTEVGKKFMRMLTYNAEKDIWREVPYINEETTYDFSGKVNFTKIPDYMPNSRMRFTYGDEGIMTTIGGKHFELSLSGSSLVGTIPYICEGRRGIAKVKVNVLTGKSKFSITENDAIGVFATYAK